MSKQTIAEKWKEALKNNGYEHEALRRGDCKRLKKYFRIWRRIFKVIKLNSYKTLSVFEVGCGGAKHLIPFALHGARCFGLDFSPEVLKRAQTYIDEVNKICGQDLKIELKEGDFLNYKSINSEGYDIVFHSGVIEHFLDDDERLNFLKNMIMITKSGGYAISIVPSGTHPIREKMKRLKLGGYGIPEIDYTPVIMREEFARCGANDVKILPHNIFGYYLIDNSRGVKKIAQKLFYYLFQIIPVGIIPYNFAVRHAGALIGIAKKS